MEICEPYIIEGCESGYMTSFGKERRHGKACIFRSPSHGHTVSVDYSKMG